MARTREERELKVIPRDYPPENVVYDSTGEYAFLVDDEGTALAMAVGTIAYEEPDIVPATGATAGTPGTWTPAGSTPPATVAESGSITASPTTAWTTGQYVQGSTAGAPGEMTWSGTGWVGGRAP